MCLRYSASVMRRSFFGLPASAFDVIFSICSYAEGFVGLVSLLYLGFCASCDWSTVLDNSRVVREIFRSDFMSRLCRFRIRSIISMGINL